MLHCLKFSYLQNLRTYIFYSYNLISALRALTIMLITNDVHGGDDDGRSRVLHQDQVQDQGHQDRGLHHQGLLHPFHMMVAQILQL